MKTACISIYYLLQKCYNRPFYQYICNFVKLIKLHNIKLQNNTLKAIIKIFYKRRILDQIVELLIIE
mgnify:CR=1 FL=1